MHTSLLRSNLYKTNLINLRCTSIELIFINCIRVVIELYMFHHTITLCVSVCVGGEGVLLGSNIHYKCSTAKPYLQASSQILEILV